MNKLYTNWKEVKLGDIVDITTGQSTKSQFYNKDKEGTPFLQGRTNRILEELAQTIFEEWFINLILLFVNSIKLNKEFAS